LPNVQSLKKKKKRVDLHSELPAWRIFQFGKRGKKMQMAEGLRTGDVGRVRFLAGNDQ
jgi:hypothetical protein